MFDRFWCFRPIKDTILKANHNAALHLLAEIKVFQTYQRYNFESKSQQALGNVTDNGWCFRPIKDTILKANHNLHRVKKRLKVGVSDLSKIQF